MSFMEWKYYIEVLVAISLVSTTCIFLSEKFWAPKHHVNEPPLVPQRIPYIGHVLGLFIHGMKYFEFTR